MPCRFERTAAIPARCRLERAFGRRAEKFRLETSSVHVGYRYHKLHHVFYHRWYALPPIASLVLFLDTDPVSISVTLMFCLGDIESVANSPTGQPYIAVVLNATQSVAATKVLAIVILVLVVACSVNGVTTTSRQLW